MEIEINFILKQESIENYKKTQEYINALAADLVKYNLKRTGSNSFKGTATEHNWYEIDVVIYCHEDFIESCEELNIIYFKNGEKNYEDMLEPVKKYKNYFEEREKKITEWEANGCKGYPW